MTTENTDTKQQDSEQSELNEANGSVKIHLTVRGNRMLILPKERIIGVGESTDSEKKAGLMSQVWMDRSDEPFLVQETHEYIASIL